MIVSSVPMWNVSTRPVGDIARIQYKGINLDPEGIRNIVYDRYDHVDIKDIPGENSIPYWKSALLIQHESSNTKIRRGMISGEETLWQ